MHVHSSLHSHQRCVYIPCVILAPGVSIASSQSPGSAAHPRQQRSKSLRSQHASRAGTRRPRAARSLHSSLLLWLEPAAPTHRARCPAASSSRPATRLVDVGSCGTGLERMDSDDTACMPCDGTGGGRGWWPHEGGHKGCRYEWRRRGALIARAHHALRAGCAGWRSARNGCGR